MDVACRNRMGEDHQVTEIKDNGNKRCLKTGAGLLAAAAGMQLLARNAGGVGTWYAHHLYPILVGIIGRISGVFPFSVVEIGLYLLIFGGIVYIVRFRRDPRRIAARTVLLCGVLLFLYTCNCGMNYYAASFVEYADLDVDMYSGEELEKLCAWLAAKVNENATQESYQDHRREWRQEGVRSMKRAGELYPVLAGYYPLPKEIAVSEILSVQQLTGIYSPFTIEANFNGDIPDYNVPHTICHELSHLKGFMREEEANFVGYLACVNSESQAFRYSGYLTGWVYAGNALARVDRTSYGILYEMLCEQAKKDLQENNEFWDRYEGKVAEAANQMNDVYLKVNNQKDGVKSYGRMVDLMLAYYFQKQ